MSDLALFFLKLPRFFEGVCNVVKVNCAFVALTTINKSTHLSTCWETLCVALELRAITFLPNKFVFIRYHPLHRASIYETKAHAVYEIRSHTVLGNHIQFTYSINKSHTVSSLENHSAGIALQRCETKALIAFRERRIHFVSHCHRVNALSHS